MGSDGKEGEAIARATLIKELHQEIFIIAVGFAGGAVY